MNLIPKFILSLFFISVFSASTCDEPEEKEGSNENNIVIINNGNNQTITNNQTSNNRENNQSDNNKGGEEYPFQNVLESAFEQIELMSYKCYADGEEKGTRLTFLSGGNAKLDDFEGSETTGTWSLDDGKITVSLPEISFNETTTLIAVDLDVIASLVFPSTLCGALNTNNETVNQEAILYCAAHEWTSMVIIENSEFTFLNNGFVQRRHWEELLSVPDTLYSTYDGIWKNVDGVIYLVFPRESGEGDSIRYLTMTPENERYRVQEFTHPSGSELCEWK